MTWFREKETDDAVNSVIGENLLLFSLSNPYSASFVTSFLLTGLLGNCSGIFYFLADSRLYFGVVKQRKVAML